MTQEQIRRAHHTPAGSRGGGVRWLGLGAMFAAGMAVASPGLAQDYPNRPVTMVIGFAPGGGSDVTGRIISAALQERLGQPVVPDNRPGAGSTIAADIVANADPDGYTLMYMSSDGISLGAALRPDLPYDPLGAFEFVGRIVGFPYIIAANPDLPFDTLEGMIAYARENPNDLRYGSSGVGSGPQMATELIAFSAGVEMEHVAFPGAAPAAVATVSGEIEIVVAAPSTVQAYGESGQLNILGVTGLERHPNFPDAPTLAEAGLEEMEITIWWGVVAPAGTPEPILAALKAALADVAADAGVAEQLANLGFDLIYLDAEAFRQFAEEDIERWTVTAREANITLE
jgi:tripartite-type tricarboxylate transporter receptor subunit TctC